MKVSQKLSLLSVSLCALTLILCGTAFLLAVYRESLDAEREAARARLGFLSASYAFAVDREGEAPLSPVVERSRRQYLFGRFEQGDGLWQLDYNGETLFNSAGLSLDRILDGEEMRLVRLGDRYAIVTGTVLDDGSAIYLLHDCTVSLDTAKRLTVRFVWIAAGAFLVIAAALLLLTHRLLSPLKSLERAAKQIAAGDYETPIRVRQNDEIGSLAMSFERMRQSVQTHIRAVSDVAEERKLLLGALTHELKTPMTAIIGYSEALETLRLSPEQQKESIAFLHRESVRLEALTQKMMRLITLEDADAIDAAPLSGERLYALLFPMLEPIAQKKAVRLTLDLFDFSAAADADLIVSVLANLFDNAVSAGAAAVRITGRGSVLTVTDNGKGMTPEVLRRVTEPFFRADKARSRGEGHAGLGLALAGRIVRLHGGTLAFSSVPGEGTTVTVTLVPIEPQPDGEPRA